MGGRLNQSPAAGTKTLQKCEIVPREPIFDQEGTCLDPLRRTRHRLNLIQDLSATVTKLDRLLVHGTGFIHRFESER